MTPHTTSVLAFLLLLVISVLPSADAKTLFETIIPNACVEVHDDVSYLHDAGSCVMEMGCFSGCFGLKENGNAISPVTAATVLSLDTDALKNFYIPVDAIDCDQFEEPICPATTCCPACKDHLDALYKCIILQSDHHYIGPLARTCPMDCLAFIDDNTIDPPSNVTDIDSDASVIEYDVTVVDLDVTVVDSNAAAPVVDSNAAAPVVDPNAAAPVVDSNVPATVVDPNAAAPVVDSNVAAPVVDSNVAEFVVNENSVTITVYTNDWNVLVIDRNDNTVTFDPPTNPNQS